MQKKNIYYIMMLCIGILFIVGCGSKNSANDSDKELIAKAKYDLLVAEAFTDATDETKLKDRVTFDFTGYVDDVAFEGGTATDYVLVLGSQQFIPGFEDQMIGHKIDEKFDVVVTFPKDYQSADLAGKEARFEILIHRIERYDENAKFDDAFVVMLSKKYADMTELKTVKDFEAHVIKNKEVK